MNSKLILMPQISLTHLFSSFVFAEYKEEVTITEHVRKITELKTKKVVFSFDSLIDQSFPYLFSMFKALQMENADEYIFCFFPETPEDVNLVNQKFILYAKEELFDIDKIKIEFLRNPRISPVNNI
ncbi:hypothetical protein [Aminipila terrae]|uniref:Uncharacterized protein n=1 Tax=Aminipila terrae TaxID=2697030 RepID=A0A6P1MIR6_9FIRM|nr:hypothetical protein [Aminipila terrae]QHI73083.1 hypothetical protein Ami3637_12335 [Aminipila terrae]